MDADEKARINRERGGELGRMAAKLLKTAGPRARKIVEDGRPKVEKAIQDARPKVEKAVEVYRPKLEQAGRDAMKYAQEHDRELKGMALQGARRLGPLGMAIDALGVGAQPATSAGAARTCPHCMRPNAADARFCSECGARLPETPGAAGNPKS
jgi:hypothetical protein